MAQQTLTAETGRPRIQSTRMLLARGIEHHRRGQIEEAEQLYGQVLRVKPNHVAALRLRGAARLEMQQPAIAAPMLQRSVELDPNDPEAHSNLGVALRILGRAEDAIACYRRAVDLKADHADALNNLADALTIVGRQDEALDAAHRALEANPRLPIAYYTLSKIKRFEREDADLEAMQRLADEADALPPARTIHLWFALGKALMDIEEHDRALDCLEKGNHLKRAEIRYDLADERSQFERIQAIFDRQRLARNDGGDPSDVPVFIVGMPRSGTTLVEQILASHPAVHGAGELRLLSALTAQEVDLGTGAVGDLSPARCTQLGRAYAVELRRRAPSAQRITDKMPVNFRGLGMIHLMLPNARIIHCRRHPADTGLSCYQTLFRGGHGWSYDLAEIGGYYGLYTRLMDHWRRAMPDRIIEVDYEALVEHTEDESRRLVEACGLDWHDDCLRFHEIDRPVHTASNGQVRQPVYNTSVHRWKQVAHRLEPLLDALGVEA